MLGNVSVTQLPVNSNIATTGHKLQGMSKDTLIVNSWNYGHANWIYVVLSRVRTRSGLYLAKPLDLDREFNVPQSLINFERRMKMEKEAPLLGKDHCKPNTNINNMPWTLYYIILTLSAQEKKACCAWEPRAKKLAAAAPQYLCICSKESYKKRPRVKRGDPKKKKRYYILLVGRKRWRVSVHSFRGWIDLDRIEDRRSLLLDIADLLTRGLLESWSSRDHLMHRRCS